MSATLTELPPAAVGKHYNPAKMTHGGPDAVVRVRPGRLGPVGFARLPGNQHSLPAEIPRPEHLSQLPTCCALPTARCKPPPPPLPAAAAPLNSQHVGDLL